ncbi:MAG: hypothetical protein OXQ26_03850, partial [bacterium]|nr:hypothetical protein [bacterium]
GVGNFDDQLRGISLIAITKAAYALDRASKLSIVPATKARKAFWSAKRRTVIAASDISHTEGGSAGGAGAVDAVA